MAFYHDENQVIRPEVEEIKRFDLRTLWHQTMAPDEGGNHCLWFLR